MWFNVVCILPHIVIESYSTIDTFILSVFKYWHEVGNDIIFVC